MKFIPIVSGVVLACWTIPVSAATIGGVEFPQGLESFADEVVASNLGDGVSNNFAKPNDVLGAPDYQNNRDADLRTGAFALGRPGQNPDNTGINDPQFGFVTVKFTDNSLTTSGNDDDDLFIFEIGSATPGAVTELFQVEISKDNQTWIDLGTFSGSSVAGIDIDVNPEVNVGDLFSYVRVTDAPEGGESDGPLFAGPDIDAIGAISSAPPVPPAVPLPAAGWALLAGIAALFGMKRRAL